MRALEINEIIYEHGTSVIRAVPDHLIPLSKDICKNIQDKIKGTEVWGAVHQKFEDGYEVMIVGFYIPNPDRYADKSRQGPATLDRKAYFEITT